MFSPPENTPALSPADPRHILEDAEGGVSMSPPQFRLDATGDSAGQAPVQKKGPEDEVQRDNEFLERTFTRLSLEQQYAIEAFAAKTRGRLAGWADLRQMHTEAGSSLSYKDYNRRLFEMAANLKTGWREFVQHFGNIERQAMVYDEALGILMPETKYDYIFDFEDAEKELMRQLDSGHTALYLREIVGMHAYQLDNDHSLRAFADVLDIPYRSVEHVYTLTSRLSVDATKFRPQSGEGQAPGPKMPKGKTTGTVDVYEIAYENELGLKWKVLSVGGMIGKSVGGSVGVSTGVSVDSKLGTAKEQIYYAPPYFAGQEATMTKGEADGPSGKAVRGVLSIGNVNFDLAKSADGKSNSAGLSAGVSFGWFRGGDPCDVEGFAEDPESKAKEKAANSVVPVIGASVHFATESIELQGDDHENIEEVVQAILSHERYFPGDIFLAQVTGFASRRWETPDESANAYGLDLDEAPAKEDQLNTGLALSRAEVVKDELAARIAGNSLAFTPGVLGKSRIVTDAQVLNDEAFTENDPAARSAVITVFYQQSPTKNVNYSDVDRMMYHDAHKHDF